MAALLLFYVNIAAAARSGDAKRVFILHSYDLAHICGAPQHLGILQALEDEGYRVGANLRLEVFALDTKCADSSSERIARRTALARKRIEAFHPDVLVTLDDNAFLAVGLAYAGTSLPVVFSGLNGQPEDYDREHEWMDTRAHPGGNITGVYEQLHFVDAVRVQRRILPNLRKILMFSDTSVTGKALERQVQLEMEREKLPCAFELVVVRSWEEYRREVLRASADPGVDTIYPAALLLRDASGRSRTAEEILRWTVRHSKKPMIPINYSFASLGVLGGAGVDFESMGRQAGALVVRILRGAAPGDLPIEDARRYALVFNLNRARELGVVIPDDILMAADEVYRD